MKEAIAFAKFNRKLNAVKLIAKPINSGQKGDVIDNCVKGCGPANPMNKNSEESNTS